MNLWEELCRGYFTKLKRLIEEISQTLVLIVYCINEGVYEVIIACSNAINSKILKLTCRYDKLVFNVYGNVTVHEILL